MEAKVDRNKLIDILVNKVAELTLENAALKSVITDDVADDTENDTPSEE